jgi:2-polyprenyl-6-methoxyphenol hydroxylase-like FAD-dependent oxidoreductase
MAIARSVAIIGGGVGGLTAANSLKRAGLSVSLYERSPYFIPTAGAGFGLQPNGQISLAYIGLKDQARNLIQPFLTWQIINDKGEVLNKTGRFGEYEKRFGYYLGGALRAELVDLLKEPIEKSHDLHYSHNMIDLEQDSDGVTISFEQQKPVRVDMVIGADGIHSTVVKQIFSQTAPAMHSKENIFYGVIENIDQQTSINPLITAKNTMTQYFGRGEFISYRVGNQGQFIWAATYPSDEPPTKSNDAEWTGLNNQRELNRILTSRFPLSHPVHQCAAATDQQRLLHFGLFYRQPRDDGWHRGRICLLGDSCHATLPYIGQGANLAIEDAISLTLCLEKSNFQIEPAFQEYYKKRFERTKRAVNMARYLGLFFHSENPIVHSIRQRLIPWLMGSNLMLKLAEKELYDNCPVPIEHKKIIP